MAVYGVNQEGAAALNQLSADLSNLNNNIAESSTLLLNTINGLSDGLGIYEKEIMEVLRNVTATQKKGSDSIDFLAKKASTMSKQVEALVSSGFVQ